MDTLEKLANARKTLLFGQRQGSSVELAEVGPGTEATSLIAGDDTRGAFSRECRKNRNKLLKLIKHGRADFIGWVVVKCELNDTFVQFPTQCLASKILHACCLFTARVASEASRWSLAAYMASISAAHSSLTASRRIFP